MLEAANGNMVAAGCVLLRDTDPVIGRVGILDLPGIVDQDTAVLCQGLACLQAGRAVALRGGNR